MKKLIKADLTEILRLVSQYQPVNSGSIETDIAALSRCAHTDYLFLTRREKSWLFDLPAVYTQDSYENLSWLYGAMTPDVPVIALLLHVDKTVEGRPWGSVTLLDYPATAQDVETFAPLPEPERERHIQRITKRYTHHVRYCSLLEVIQYLKTGEVK
ncbi:hypothetical protein [Oscillibacter ruminantium]|uniref:hypothetical protein n=1 Tax=Oscillibacter ruminantium TaxID=1263547 RepID=UPI00331E2D8A